ncbi:MAG: ABC transporter permease [Blastocatellia bacterium]
MPNWNHIVRQRLAVLRLPPEREIEIVEEVALHLEAIYDDARAEGLSEDEAQARTLQSYDWQLLECELSRVEGRWHPPAETLDWLERKGGMRMESLWQDLHFGARMLMKNRVFTLITVLTLALGIGANTALFSFADAVLFRPLPFVHPERLVLMKGAAGTLVDMGFDKAEKFMQWNHAVQSFEYVAAYDAGRVNLADQQTPERVQMMRVTGQFFPMLGVNPMLGRWFSQEEQRKGSHQVLILSHRLWQSRYGAAADILQKTVRVNGHSFQIIGVMPPSFQFAHDLERADMWMPLVPKDYEVLIKDSFYYEVSGKLKPGVTMATAQAELNLLNQQLKLSEKRMGDYVNDQRLTLAPLSRKFAGNLREPLLLLLASLAFVLLLACANVANLLLTRAVARQKELAIRAALGAARWRLMRLWMAESLLLSLAGGALGLLASRWLLSALVAFSPQNASPVNVIGVNGRVIAFCVGVTLLTGLLFGLVPALQSSKPDLSQALKESGQRSSGGLSPRLRRILIVGEVAIALVLLIGAGLMIKSFRTLLQVPPGLNPERVLTFELSPTLLQYDTKEKRATLYQTAVERLRAIPGIISVGAITHLPIAHGGGMGLPLKVEGRPNADEDLIGLYQAVTADYFRTLEIPLLAGRSFTEQDHAGAGNVMVLNQKLAQKLFQNENPVGKRIVLGMEKPTPFTVIGVVGDVRTAGLDESAFEEFYLHAQQHPPGFASFALKTALSPANFVPAVIKTMEEIDRNQPLYRVKTMEQHLADSVAERRFPMMILAVFALTALLLAALGLYGVMSYTVAQRTHEIGIRVALGAQTKDVLLLVIGQGMTLTLIGVALGLAAAFGLTRLMQGMLYSVSPTDSLTFIGIAVLLLFVALLACWIPARRATKVDPLIALRSE